jgi:hypothetical protein
MRHGLSWVSLGILAATLSFPAVTLVSTDGAAIASPLRAAASKRDRLARPRPESLERVQSQTIMERPARVLTMRDRHGAVVYEAIEEARSTRVTKNAEVPSLPSIVARPASVERPREIGRSKVPVGCDRLVSALVRSASADQVGRCVT